MERAVPMINTPTSSIFRERKSGAYDLGISPGPVYCHMGDGNFGCGEGGWTTVMKIDGAQVLFFKVVLFHCGRQGESAILISRLLIRMRRMYQASIRLDFH